MQINVRNLAIGAALAAAAAATWFLSRPAAPVAPRSAAASDTPLGYYLKDAVVHGTDADGRTYYRIHAAEAVQNPDDDALALRDVRVEYRDAAAVDWSILAERATRGGPDDPIALESVRLESPTAANGEPMRIETPRITLDPVAQTAATDAEVTVQLGDASLRAVGLRAELATDDIELESQVHGVFPN